MNIANIYKGLRVRLLENNNSGTVINMYRNIVVVKLDNGEIVRTISENIRNKCEYVLPSTNIVLVGKLDTFENLYKKLGDISIKEAVLLKIYS